MNTWKISCRGRNSPGRSAADRMYTVWGAARKAPCYCALTFNKQGNYPELMNQVIERVVRVRDVFKGYL